MSAYEFVPYAFLVIGVLMVMMGASVLQPVSGQSFKAGALQLAISGSVIALGAIFAWTAFSRIIG